MEYCYGVLQNKQTTTNTYGNLTPKTYPIPQDIIIETNFPEIETNTLNKCLLNIVTTSCNSFVTDKIKP